MQVNYEFLIHSCFNSYYLLMLLRSQLLQNTPDTNTIIIKTFIMLNNLDMTHLFDATPLMLCHTPQYKVIIYSQKLFFSFNL